MAEFEVKVVEISDVQEHPNADRLTLIRVGGYTCIANKHDDGSWRYHAGDLVVYIPENALVPEWLLRRQGMWNDEKGVGLLAGSKGNRVKAIRLRAFSPKGFCIQSIVGVISQMMTIILIWRTAIHMAASICAVRTWPRSLASQSMSQ